MDEALACTACAHPRAHRGQDTSLLVRPVPEGRIVAVSIWGIHHNPAVWSEPDGFDPARFDPDRFDAHAPAADRRASRPGTPISPSAAGPAPASAST